MDSTRAVYCITGPDGDSRGQGTGFACAREGGDLLLVTCWHVVREIGPGQLRVQGQICDLVSDPGDDQLDLAVLLRIPAQTGQFFRLDRNLLAARPDAFISTFAAIGPSLYPWSVYGQQVEVDAKRS